MTLGFSFNLLIDILVLIRLYTADIADVFGLEKLSLLQKVTMYVTDKWMAVLR